MSYHRWEFIYLVIFVLAGSCGIKHTLTEQQKVINILCEAHAQCKKEMSK